MANTERTRMQFRIKAAALAVLALIAVGLAAGMSAGCTTSPKAAAEEPTRVILLDGTVATSTPLPTVPAPREVPDGLETVWEAYSILAREYVDQTRIDPAVLQEGAIKGMIEALGDRHTGYITPGEMKVEQANFGGEFEGIGAHVEKSVDGKKILIVAPLPDSPAEQSGIKAGDAILAVNGEATDGWTIEQAVNTIRGPRGTPVTLSILHLGAIDPVDITIVRGSIKQDSVTSRMLPDDSYGVVKISTFTARSHEEMTAAVSRLVDDGAKGIILDLRQNPGGLLSSVQDISSEFIASGLVTYEIDSRGRRTDWAVKPGGRYLDLPMVILVNGFSASGSEVLSGAMQDHGRAVVIGTKTFGKGSVNFLRNLSNGGGLYLTVARWYTPNGRLIEAVGVVPDVVVEFPQNVNEKTFTEDPQIAAAIKQLNFQLGAVPAGR